MSDNNVNIPDILSITQMSKLLNLSRSRFYQLMSENIFLPPIYSTNSKRPFYTKEIAERNLVVKKNNTGVNGKVVLFYTSRNSSPLLPRKKKYQKDKINNISTEDNHTDNIREGLSALGLDGVSDSQIESAVKKCFPEGTDNIDFGEILRQVFLSIRRWNTTDNVNR